MDLKFAALRTVCSVSGPEPASQQTGLLGQAWRLWLFVCAWPLLCRQVTFPGGAWARLAYGDDRDRIAGWPHCRNVFFCVVVRAGSPGRRPLFAGAGRIPTFAGPWFPVMRITRGGDSAVINRQVVSDSRYLWHRAAKKPRRFRAQFKGGGLTKWRKKITRRTCITGVPLQLYK